MDSGLTDQATARPAGAGRSPFREHMRRFARWSRRHPRIAWVTATAAIGLVLFWCYLRQAQTYQLNADPAGQALQAWDMLHGNLLLRGWWLGDVSFYTVELPLNMIIEAIVGLRPVEIPILAALIYTAVVLLTALLAKGSARGREGVVRALLGGGILLAPSLVLGTRVLMQGPDHLGTAVPILLMLLVLDRAPERWWVPVVVGVLLTLAQVSDVLATFAGAAAVAVACGVRVFLDDRPPPAPAEVRGIRPLPWLGRGRLHRAGAPGPMGDQCGRRLLHAPAEKWPGLGAALRTADPRLGHGLQPADPVRRRLLRAAHGRRRGPGPAPPGRGRPGPVGAADRPVRLLRPRRGPGHSGARGQHRHHLGGGNVRQLHVQGRRRPRDRHRAAVLRGARRQAPRRRAGQGEAALPTARRWARLLPRSARLQRHPADPGSVARGSRGLAGSSPFDDRPGTVLGIEHHLAR